MLLFHLTEFFSILLFHCCDFSLVLLLKVLEISANQIFLCLACMFFLSKHSQDSIFEGFVFLSINFYFSREKFIVFRKFFVLSSQTIDSSFGLHILRLDLVISRVWLSQKTLDFFVLFDCPLFKLLDSFACRGRMLLLLCDNLFQTGVRLSYFWIKTLDFLVLFTDALIQQFGGFH